MYVVPAGTEAAVGVTGFHVGLRCLLMGATLITLGKLDEAEQVCINYVCVPVSFIQHVQILKNTYQCEAALKNHEKHILSFATYELGTIYFERKQVCRWPVYLSSEDLSTTYCMLLVVNIYIYIFYC